VNFLVDTRNNIKITYEELLIKINNYNSLRGFIYTNSIYEIFSQLIHSMIYGYRVCLLDSSFTKNEIRNLGLDPRDILKSSTLTNNKIVEDPASLLEHIRNTSPDWRLTIYTSGTTGQPKEVEQTFDRLTRHVKTGVKHENDVWAFAYDPTHMAGLQVFYQALLNLNTIVNIFCLSGDVIADEINNHHVTSISSTPTFYRLLANDFIGGCPTIKRVTLGGERFDKQLECKLRKLFPDAKIRNVYASTEVGSLLGSSSGLFEIPEAIQDKVKVSGSNELLVHRSLMPGSNDILFTNDWYHTGDVVKFVDGKRFEFQNRKNELINIGGYNVNPSEVERQINSISYVVDSLVYSKESKLIGSLLVADVQLQTPFDLSHADAEIEISKLLNQKLQKWKVPRLFYFKDEIELTRTGKKKRL